MVQKHGRRVRLFGENEAYQPVRQGVENPRSSGFSTSMARQARTGKSGYTSTTRFLGLYFDIRMVAVIPHSISWG